MCFWVYGWMQNWKLKENKHTKLRIKENKENAEKVKQGGEGKPEVNPNKVKTRQGKVNCNVNLKKERRLTRLDPPQA